MDVDMQGMRIQSLLLAAEAARLENRLDQAVRILDAAHALYPEQPEILNNLVYVLSQRGETLERARALLPRLLDIGLRSYAALDTAGVVAMRGGDLAQAEAWMLEALDLLQARAYGAHEVRLNLAELRVRQGRGEEAQQLLLALRQDPARPDQVDQRARQMLQDLEMAVRP
jgi:Flp pilus assembly protein TadD